MKHINVEQAGLNAPPCRHLGKRKRTSKSFSSLGELKATRKRQSCHKLAIGNWSITSLTGNEHKLVDKAIQYTPKVGPSSTECHGWNPADLEVMWILFTHVLSQHVLAMLRWTYLSNRPLSVFDTNIRFKLKYTLPRILGGNLWYLEKC